MCMNTNTNIVSDIDERSDYEKQEAKKFEAEYLVSLKVAQAFGDHRFTIGKYKHIKVKEVPINYLYWLLDNHLKYPFWKELNAYLALSDDLSYLWDLYPDGRLSDGMVIYRDELGYTHMTSGVKG